MGRRSSFKRRKFDAYATPAEAVPALARVLPPGRYVELCAGDGALMRALSLYGFECTFAQDIMPRHPSVRPGCMFELNECAVMGADYIITNPPWTRALLHPFIHHAVRFGKPVWLLFGTPWLFTEQAYEFRFLLRRVVAMPRLQWVPDSRWAAKDDAGWYEFGPPSDRRPEIILNPGRSNL